MSDSIFREKSLKRISSPESLNDYVKVANPGIWVILIAVISLLIGFIAWGAFGWIDSQFTTIGVVKDGVLTTYIKEEDMKNITKESLINIDGVEYDIYSIDNTPIMLDYGFNESYLHIANMSSESWICKIISNTDLPKGEYKVSVISERIKPISLLFD